MYGPLARVKRGEMSDFQHATIPAPPTVVWVMALVFTLLELVFQLGTTGESLRIFAVTRFAFFDLWFQEALAGYDVPILFWSSFFTYAFLHGGVLHLVMNGAIFLALGGFVANAIGTGRFLILFLFSSAVGALFWALLFSGSVEAHLVGASGAIFGFIGALKRWEWIYLRQTGGNWQRFRGTIMALIIMNVALALMLPGGAEVAWEAHLGGFVGGWLIAPLLAPGRAAPSPL